MNTEELLKQYNELLVKLVDIQSRQAEVMEKELVLLQYIVEEFKKDRAEGKV